MQREPVSFLIVDDDKVSVMSMQRVIRKLRLINPVKVAKDGLEALEILSRVNSPGELQSPYIVILDLNMPRMSGHEFLKVIREDPALKDTIVFVVTTSDAPHDVKAAYASHVAGYILKDHGPESFRDALELLGAYSEVVLLPTGSAA